jgi:hypothetical protein
MFISNKKVADFLSKSCFLDEFNPLNNETCQKVWMLLFVDLFGPFVLFVNGMQTWTPSAQNLEVNFPSTQGFCISMVNLLFAH